MSDTIFGLEYLKELEAETKATRKCLERIPETLFNWKPHEKSMTLGYLALLVAEIPKWITYMIEKSEIDFATFEHIVRRQDGGKFNEANTVLACRKCNTQREVVRQSDNGKKRPKNMNPEKWKEILEVWSERTATIVST